jgi:sterol desaturase/sphingolipid hydroxylase (fatty acid hydroxylase superfamily)
VQYEFPEHFELWLLATFVATFAVVNVLEAHFPRRDESSNRARRWGNNIALAILTISLTNYFQVLLNLTAAWWVDEKDFGLLAFWDPGPLLSLLLTFLVLELSGYIYHRLLHAIPWLWRLHAVHHSDTGFDFSLAYRNHPLAAAVLVTARMPVIVLLGAPMEYVFAYELTRIVQDLLSHSNVRIAPGWEKYLRYVLVTPDFHRLHHSSDRRHTDSNFSSTFPWFDYLFGTATDKPFEMQQRMEVGLEYFRGRKDMRLDRLLLMPFRSRA